jgi:glutamyl-tRNA synthetase
VKADLAQWWTLFSDGAAPLIDPEDAEFVAKAMALLPPRPWTTETWGQWTTAVKEATGRKGQGRFSPPRVGRARVPGTVELCRQPPGIAP